MMRIVLIIALTLSLFACKRDNDFDGIEAENSYDQQTLDLISVDSVEEINCRFIKMKFSIKRDNLPDTSSYTHVLIKDENNNAQKFPTTINEALVSVKCNKPTVFALTLFDEAIKKESYPTIYTYNP